MSIDHTTFLKNFQPVIGSYQDVSAIYTKLCTQGQLQKIVHLLNEVYDEEHVFTLTELQNYCKNNNQKEEEFVAEQYELNSNIFRRNLTLIVQSLVEEIGKKFLERFRHDYSSGSPTEEVSFKQNHTTEQSLSSEKAHYKSYMPKIQEETESHKMNKIAKAFPTETENASNNNKTFDLSINELTHKVQPPQHGSPNHHQNQREVSYEIENQNQNQSQNQMQMQAQQYERLKNQQQQRKVSPIQNQREDFYENQANSYYKNETSGFGISGEPTRADDFSQYDHENGTFRVSQEKFHHHPVQNRTPQSTGHNWSSPERTNAFVKKNIQALSNHRNQKVLSPGRVERNATASELRHTYAKWSAANGRPDPSILDSEFNYTQGGSFSKSPKRFHYNIQDIPGPGDYLTEEGVQATKIQHPNHSFTKSPKTPAYFTKSKVPGYVYYPVKFFSSK